MSSCEKTRIDVAKFKRPLKFGKYGGWVTDDILSAMADSELARQFKSHIVCDFCGYQCNDEALYDDHLQSHIVGCCTTSSDFAKEESCNNECDDPSRRALSDDPRLGAGFANSKAGNSVRLVTIGSLSQTSTSRRSVDEPLSALPENRSGSDAYNCAVCGVGFHTLELYQRHVRTHVQKIDAALNRQGIFPEIVPVRIVPLGSGQSPKVVANKKSTVGVKVQTEVDKPKSLDDNNPIEKTYNDKLSDTVEALRLSLLKQSTPVSANSTSGVYELSLLQGFDNLQTAGEVLVTTTNSLEVAGGDKREQCVGPTSRKRKQELVPSVTEPIPTKTIVQDRNLLYCFNSDNSDCEAEDVETGTESRNSRCAGDETEKDWTSDENVNNAGAVSDDDSSSCGDGENRTSGDRKVYKLMKEHSYPILATKSSASKPPQHSSILQNNFISADNSHGPAYSSASKTYMCNICGVKFSVFKNLDRHLKTHRKQKRRKLEEHFAAVSNSKDKIGVKVTPTTVAKAFGIISNSKMFDAVHQVDHFNKYSGKERPIVNPPLKTAPSQSSKSLHWVTNKIPQQQRRTTSSVLNIKCFCGRKFSSVPSFRKHMQCHVHGPSRANAQNDEISNVDCPPIRYDAEDTVESVYNVLRNDLGNPSLPSFVTEKAPRPKPAPDPKKITCPQCGLGFTSVRYVNRHMGSKRCMSQVRQNWQASQKIGSVNEPSYCSDCGVAVPSYAPKVLARHIVNVPDEVKCRFCVLKLDRVRNAASKKDLPVKVIDSFPESQKASVSVDVSSESAPKPVKVDVADVMRTSAPELIKADTREVKIVDASRSVKGDAANTTTGGAESQCDNTRVDTDSRVASLPSALESKDLTQVVQTTPSTSAASLSVAGFGAEMHKEYKCDKCGLVYLSQWSFSRHREKFCASKINSVSSILNPDNSSGQQHDSTNSTNVLNSGSSCEVAEAANSSDLTAPKLVELSDGEVEDRNDDDINDYTIGSFMGIDLGDSSDDEPPSKENDSTDEKDCSDNDSDPDLYQCNFCDNRSTSPLSYKEHLQTHVSVVLGTDDHTSFYCEKCAIHTSNILHQCHSVSELRTSTCGICLRQFQSIESAKMHALKCHDGTKLLFCVGCYWGFGSSEELKEHVSECEGCIIRSSPRGVSYENSLSPERGVLETDSESEPSTIKVLSSASSSWSPPCMLPLKSKLNCSTSEMLPISNEQTNNAPDRNTSPLLEQSRTMLDVQDINPASQSGEVSNFQKSMSFRSTGKFNIEPVKLPAAPTGCSNTVQTIVESPPSVDSNVTLKVVPFSLKDAISTIPSTMQTASKKPLSYADILGVRSHSPALATSSALQSDLDYKSSPVLLSTPSSQRSNKKIESKRTPSKSTGRQDSGTDDDTLDFTCYSPEMVSSPAGGSDIQSEIEDIISKLPVLEPGAALDSEIGSSGVDVVEYCSNSSAMANSACSLSVVTRSSLTIQKATMNPQEKTPTVHISNDANEGGSTPSSQSSPRLASSPFSPTVSSVRRSTRQTTALNLCSDSPSESKSRSTSPLLRKRKLASSIPDLLDVPSNKITSVNHSQEIVSCKQEVSKSLQPLMVTQKTSSDNGIKLKLVRITLPQKEGIKLPSNLITYKLVSGTPSVASTSESSNASSSIPVTNVQGAAIDSTIQTKIPVNNFVSDTSSSVALKERRPVLEYLFSEIRPSSVDAVKAEADTGDSSADCLVPLLSQQLQTSPSSKVLLASKTKQKCTARKGMGSSTQSAVKKTIPGLQPTIHDTRNWKAVFTDKDGVQHLLPECKVQLCKLDESVVRLSRPNSAIMWDEKDKVYTLESLAPLKQLESKDVMPTRSDDAFDKCDTREKLESPDPSTPETPTFAINKILSSIKRFIKPYPSKVEHLSNSAIAARTPVSTTDSLPSCTKNVVCVDVSNETTCKKSPVMPKSHSWNSPPESTTLPAAGFPVRSVSPAESASVYPVFKRRACRTYSRTQPSPCRLTRSTSKTNLLNSSVQKVESHNVDSLQKSNTGTHDGDINKILSAFRTLIDNHDSANPPSTPQ